MPPADVRFRNRRIRTRYNPFPSPAELDERMAIQRNRKRRQRRRDIRSVQGDDPEGEMISQVQVSRTNKHNAAMMEHARNAFDNEMQRNLQATRNYRNALLLDEDNATESEGEVPGLAYGGRIGALRGAGWEEEMAKAIARDAEREKDKEVAARIRSDSASDAKRRGGKVRRYANAISHKWH